MIDIRNVKIYMPIISLSLLPRAKDDLSLSVTGDFFTKTRAQITSKSNEMALYGSISIINLDKRILEREYK